MKKVIEMKKIKCEECAYYIYNEDYECYACQINLDEDEMLHFLQGNFSDCPYYRDGDDYAVVRRQN